MILILKMEEHRPRVGVLPFWLYRDSMAAVTGLSQSVEKMLITYYEYDFSI